MSVVEATERLIAADAAGDESARADAVRDLYAECLAYQLESIARALCTALEFARDESPYAAFVAGHYMGDAAAKISKLYDDDNADQLAAYERATILANAIESICMAHVYASADARQAAAIAAARKRRARK